MSKKGIFTGVEQALNVTYHMGMRLAFLMTWCLLWLAHLTLALLMGALMWWYDVRAQEAAAALLALAVSTPIAIAGTVGVSVIGLAAGYWKLCQWSVRKARSGWLLAYLMQDVRG